MLLKTRLDHIVEQAVAEGILPAGATPSAPLMRPWPVIVLTALGGWLCSLPLLALLLFLLLDAFAKTPLPYVIGLGMLMATIAALRSKSLPFFLEQLSIPMLLAAMTLFSAKLWYDTSAVTGLFGAAILVMAVAIAIPYNWMRALLAGAANGILVAALMVYQSEGYNVPANAWAILLFALYLAAAVWAASQVFKPVLPDTGSGLRQAQAIDAMSMGWGAVTLAGLALYSGATFMSSTFLPGQQGGYGPDLNTAEYFSWQAISVIAAAGAVWHLAAKWPSLRRPWAAVAALVALALSALMPSLGATLVILALSATAGRWTMAGAAGFAAAWIIGAFYYQMSIPFVTKALIMMAAGGLLGASAWFALRGAAAGSGHAAVRLPGLRNAAGIAVTAVAVLLVSNGAIWQKESIIANGQTVFLRLAPVDPRSLMQGDYMALRIPIGQGVAPLEGESSSTAMAVGQLDANRILTVTRIDDGSALAPGEMRIAVMPSRGSAVIATDAFHFREGDAARYENAGFGEFRLGADGVAVLVGLRGPNLEPL